MRRLFKTISLVTLPIITLIFFLIIGRNQTYHEYMEITRMTHHAMSTYMYMNIWIGRGIYSMLLVIAILFVLFSKATNIRKVLTFLMLILLNVAMIYAMFILIPNPQFMLIIPIVNLLAFAPFYIKVKSKIY
jgi:hypothetical protein